MKFIFKHKVAAVLNLILLLGINTNAYAAETRSTPADTKPTTIDGGFTEPDRAMLTRVDTTTKTIVDYVDGIGQPTDLATQTNTLFGLNRYEIELLTALTTSIAAGGGLATVNANLTEVLTRIGLSIPNGSTLFTEIAKIISAIDRTKTDLGASITTSESNLLRAISAVSSTVGTSDTNISQILSNLNQLIRRVGIINFSGKPSDIGSVLGDPHSCHTNHHTLFGRLHSIMEEIRGISVASKNHGFKKYLKGNEDKLEVLGQGINLLLNQLCASGNSERYLPHALVSLNSDMKHIIKLLSSGTDRIPVLYKFMPFETQAASLSRML